MEFNKESYIFDENGKVVSKSSSVMKRNEFHQIDELKRRAKQVG